MFCGQPNQGTELDVMKSTWRMSKVSQCHLRPNPGARPLYTPTAQMGVSECLLSSSQSSIGQDVFPLRWLKRILKQLCWLWFVVEACSTPNSTGMYNTSSSKPKANHVPSCICEEKRIKELSVRTYASPMACYGRCGPNSSILMDSYMLNVQRPITSRHPHSTFMRHPMLTTSLTQRYLT